MGLRVDVNTASPEDLASIPGLSAKLAAAIVDDRARHGPFQSLDTLLRVPGIGPARLARARPFLATGP
jgi:competence protein ComEA